MLLELLASVGDRQKLIAALDALREILLRSAILSALPIPGHARQIALALSLDEGDVRRTLCWLYEQGLITVGQTGDGGWVRR